jgi:2,4-dienoyl-CoA reductase-like NADH-dependent reductase (Old Yellow Enzyme family)
MLALFEYAQLVEHLGVGNATIINVKVRILCAAYQPNGAAPISPSSKTVKEGKITLPNYEQADFPAPRQLKTEELPSMVEAYAQAARNAREAGNVWNVSSLQPM